MRDYELAMQYVSNSISEVEDAQVARVLNNLRWAVQELEREASNRSSSVDAPKRVEAEGSVSLRDYFAAHAPEEPQGWFAPVMPTVCPDPFGDKDAYDEWQAVCRTERLIQWPHAWADAVIASDKALKAREEQS